MLKAIRKSYHKWRRTMPYLKMELIKAVPSRHIRMFLLRKQGATIGERVSMFKNVTIRNPKGLVIESGSSIGPGVLLDARKGLHIGKNVTIASDAIIWSLHHDMNSSDFHVIGDKTEIGDYSWICSRSIILPGVKVGRGAVVASGAVVTKNIEPQCVMGGVPAKKIGERKQTEFNYEPFFDLHIV